MLAFLAFSLLVLYSSDIGIEIFVLLNHKNVR